MTADYRTGFRSLDAETHLDSVPIEGEVPSWLSGSLLRTGPAKFEVGDESYRHWFDGLAMLHAFGIEEGRVSYANQFLESESYCQAREEGGIARSEFGTDPCRSIFGRVMSLFSDGTGDNANVNITRLGERFVAMTETPMPVEFDPETLETIGRLDGPTELEGDVTTAHPHFDFEANRAVNYLLKFGRESTYRVVATDPESLEREVIGRVSTDCPSYMHSFGMTDNYVVLAGFPLVVDPLSMLVSGKPFIENFEWRPELGTRFWVLRKSDGKLVGEYRGEPRFGFHHVNAFERDGELVVDVVTYRDASIIEDLYLDRLRRATPVEAAGRLERYRLKDGQAEVESEVLSETRVELPRINYRHSSTEPYGCVWGCGVHAEGNFLDQIVRIDVESGEATCWREEGAYPGEPVFVPRPEAVAEDDGVLLSVVLEAETETSFLLVLDARDLRELARARIPHHVPFQFHGNFYSSV